MKLFEALLISVVVGLGASAIVFAVFKPSKIDDIVSVPYFSCQNGRLHIAHYQPTVDPGVVINGLVGFYPTARDVVNGHTILATSTPKTIERTGIWCEGAALHFTSIDFVGDSTL